MGKTRIIIFKREDYIIFVFNIIIKKIIRIKKQNQYYIRKFRYNLRQPII